MLKRKVVIIGAGFGGVYVARNLARLIKKNNLSVTIINRTNYFLFTPLLHEVATGGLSPLAVAEPLREIFRGTEVEIVEAEATAINTRTKTVSAGSGVFSYDYLVISTGAEPAYHDVPGAARYSLPLKNLEDALRIRNLIVSRIEEAVGEVSKEQQKELLTFAVVGGGATGVEIAAEVSEFVNTTLTSYYGKTGLSVDDSKILLIASESELIPQFSPKLREVAKGTLERKGVTVMTKTHVKEVCESEIKLDDGKTLKVSMVVWAAGVKAAAAWFDLLKMPNERLVVNEFLQADNHPEIYVLGDVAALPTPQPMLAQVAVQEARAVASNIYAYLEGKKPVPFLYHSKGMLISLGQWYAAGTIFGLTIQGRFTWWLWRTIYLFNFHSRRKRLRIAAEWTINLFYPRDIGKIR